MDIVWFSKLIVAIRYALRFNFESVDSRGYTAWYISFLDPGYYYTHIQLLLTYAFIIFIIAFINLFYFLL